MKIKESTMPETIKIWKRGQLTIPKDIRERLDLYDGTPISIFQVEGSIILTPKKLLRANFSRKVKETMQKEKIALDDLITGLKEEREKYNREKYKF